MPGAGSPTILKWESLRLGLDTKDWRLPASWPQLHLYSKRQKANAGLGSIAIGKQQISKIKQQQPGHGKPAQHRLPK